EPIAWPSWLRRLVFKHCDRLRRRKQLATIALEAAIDVPSPEKQPDEILIETETKDRVIAALAGLSNEERSITTLFYISGYRQRDIAAFLEVSLDTVKNRLRSSRKKLKERMLEMTQKTLHENAPSRDDSFVNAVGICNAAQAGDLQRVKEILAVKPELAKQDIASNNEHQPIHFAAEEGHADIVRVLLEAGADPLNGIYPHREATGALTLAKDREHTAVVDVIEGWLKEERGTTSKGEAFIQAVNSGDTPGVGAALAEDAALINATDKGGQTALFKAVHRGDLPLILELLDRGAEIDHHAADGSRPIHHCLAHSWKAPDAMYKTYAIIAGALIARGAKYDLWVACGVGDVTGVKRMLDAGSDNTGAFKSRSPFWADYENPLVVTCFQGHTKVVRLLLDSGADPDSPFDIDVAGETVKQWGHPLWLAANRGHYDVVELLLERGANPNTAVYASGNAVCWAYQYGHKRIADLMFQYGAVADALSYCLTNNLAALSERLHGDASERDGLLWSAILAGNTGIVGQVLRENPQYDDAKGFDLLAQAVRGWRLGNLKINNDGFDRRDYITILEMLLSHGVNPNLRNPRDERFNFTILHHLAGKSCNPVTYGHTAEEVVEFAGLLLDHGADINATERKLKSTPLGWAARFGQKKLAAFLLERGADANLADAPWARPLAWAEKKGQTEIAGILRQHGATT
ncbi:MAG: sigma-70 family RNA polymerase sigma factor, partial [Candidatus Poribacteria bacterium]|nr:sigma-70 family RNA polymerase sigma factor [Candidatus Poribacteria bacterium]